MSTLIFHPSVAPFVQQAARALLEAGELDRFITSLRHDPGSRRQRWACRAARAARFDLETQLRRRAVTEIPLDRVESHPWGEIVRLLSSRLDRTGRLTDLVWERTEAAFDRLVARQVRASHASVYGFEYSSLATFTRARELGVKVIYDMPAPEPRFVQNLLDAEIARFPELQTAYHRHTTVREERRIARRRAEWDAADLVMVASRFTRDSFARAGLDIAKVRIVPYGAPPAIAPADAAGGGSRDGEPLRVIWAGTFSIRKGAHYLLEAWRAGGFGRHARLEVFGAVTLPDRLLQPAAGGRGVRGLDPPRSAAGALPHERRPALSHALRRLRHGRHGGLVPRPAGDHHRLRRRRRPPATLSKRPADPRRGSRRDRHRHRVVPEPPRGTAGDARRPRSPPPRAGSGATTGAPLADTLREGARSAAAPA